MNIKSVNDFNKNEVCWLYKDGMISTIRVIGISSSGTGVSFTYITGMKNGYNDITLPDHLFKFPSGKDDLVACIDVDIGYLQSIKNSVMLERRVF